MKSMCGQVQSTLSNICFTRNFDQGLGSSLIICCIFSEILLFSPASKFGFSTNLPVSIFKHKRISSRNIRLFVGDGYMQTNHSKYHLLQKST